MHADSVVAANNGNTTVYTCNQCMFVAVDAVELARHQILHSFNHQLVCKVCGYSAKSTGELIEHYEEDHAGVQHDVTPTTGILLSDVLDTSVALW